MSIENSIKEIESTFAQAKDWEDKYRQIIKYGKELEDMNDDLKIDKYKVKGCQSQVWLFPELKEGKVYFQADSDAMLVKGIISVLLKVYSGQSADDILAHEPSFLNDLGITQHLSMNRSNGLASMMKQIKMYALAMKALS
jgi:cysteine desulfuration protein SufE